MARNSGAPSARTRQPTSPGITAVSARAAGLPVRADAIEALATVPAVTPATPNAAISIDATEARRPTDTAVAAGAAVEARAPI